MKITASAAALALTLLAWTGTTARAADEGMTVAKDAAKGLM